MDPEERKEENANDQDWKEPASPPRPGPGWRDYWRKSGASILYCLSAFSIIYGITRIIGPILGTSDSLAETLPCVATLNLYEVCLLGVLVLIVLWRKVMDDAASLVILIALLLIGSGITLETIANDNPRVAPIVGGACLLLAVGKLLVMRRYASLDLRGAMLPGLGLLLIWNFLVPSVMAITLGKDAGSEILRRGWQIGWLAVLCGGFIMLLYAVWTPTGRAREAHQNKAFLQAPGMAWVFALILLTAANVHQYALAYIYDLQYGFGDFLPSIVLLCFLGLEIMRCYGTKFRYGAMTLSCVPLVAIMHTIARGSFGEEWSYSLEALWYPPVLLGITAVGLLRLSLRTRSRHLASVVPVYLLALVLTAEVSPEYPRILNWTAAGGMLSVILLALGFYYRNIPLVLAAAVILSVGLGHTAPVRGLANAHDQSLLGPICLFAGLAILIAYCIFNRGFPRWIAGIGALLLTGSVIYCSEGFAETNYPLLAAVACVILSGVVWFYTRDYTVAIILGGPLLAVMRLQKKKITGWHFVVLSFVLLATGTFISIRKGAPNRKGAHDFPFPPVGED